MQVNNQEEAFQWRDHVFSLAQGTKQATEQVERYGLCLAAQPDDEDDDMNITLVRKAMECVVDAISFARAARRLTDAIRAFEATTPDNPYQAADHADHRAQEAEAAAVRAHTAMKLLEPFTE